MDWSSFLTDNFIHYVTSGKNTSPGWISIKCPLCGDDPSEHLGCHPSGAWSCWRDASHKGRSPERLVSTLLGISGPQAALLVQAYNQVNPDSFDTPQAATSPSRGRVPFDMATYVGFSEIKKNTLTHKFWNHIKNRGFDDPDAVIYDYCLMCGLTDKYKGRLIIPIFNDKGLVIGWQGRSLRNVEGISRYLTSSPEVKQTVLNLDQIGQGGEVLYICEGPFDAIKIDFFGKPKIRATCTFGVSLSPEQIYLLSGLISKFKRTVLLFDADSAGVVGSFNLSDWLPEITFGNLPEGHKDTDLMNEMEMRRFIDVSN
jgi:hypothetical protein